MFSAKGHVVYRERNVLLIDLNLQLLSADLVGLGPVSVVLLGDFTIADNSLNLFNNQRAKLDCKVQDV